MVENSIFRIILAVVVGFVGVVLVVAGLRKLGRHRHGWIRYIVFGTMLILAAIVAPFVQFTSQSSPVSIYVPTPPASSGNPVCSTGTISIDGSTAMQPLVSDVANKYMSVCPSTHVNVNGSSNCQQALQNNGSTDGLEELANGTIDIADSDVSASNTYHNFNDHVVAAVIYVLIINPTVTNSSGTHPASISFTNLSTSEIQKIYNGTYTNWQQLGGPDQPITAIGRDSGSGTRATFDQYALKNSPETSDTNHLYYTTNGVVCAVTTTPGAIGYVSLYSALYAQSQSQGSHLLILNSIDQHPYQASIDNSYQFWALEHMYTGPKSAKLAQDFVNFMGNTTYVQPIIQNDSFKTVEEMTNILANRYQNT